MAWSLRGRRASLIFIAAILLVMAVLGVIVYYFFWQPASPGGASGIADPKSQTITLFFFQAAEEKPLVKSFLLPEHLPFPEQIRCIIEKMTEKTLASEPTLWPAALRLRNVFLRKNGLLILDLDLGVTYNHATAAGELRVLRSLVATLTSNYPNVKRFKFLVNGLEQDTLSGHVNIFWPLSEKDLRP
jgi:hypothetical protein